MRDIHNNINPVKPGIGYAVDDTAIVSGIVDVQGFDALEFLIATGTITDADATAVVLVEEGDAANLSDATAVADADLLGTEVLAAFTFALDLGCRKIGYIGKKRYVRLRVTPVGNTVTAFPVAIIPVLGLPNRAPTANPPV